MKRALIGGFYFLGGITLSANTSSIWTSIVAGILSVSGAITLLVEGLKKD